MTRELTNTHPALRHFWHPVALESDVPADAPLGVRLLGERWLVARLGGRLVGMRDRCPHRLVPLSAGTIVDDEVQCAYHGYRFDAAGRTTSIPALDTGAAIPPKACVDTAHVTTRFGMVWMCLADEPIDTLLDDAAYRDPVNDTFVSGPFTTRVSAGVLADNFLDSAHFPFLHSGTFGADDDGSRPSPSSVTGGGSARSTSRWSTAPTSLLPRRVPRCTRCRRRSPWNCASTAPERPTSSGRSCARSTTDITVVDGARVSARR